MKKLLVIVMAILLVSGLILSGCTEPAPEATTEPAPTATTEPAPVATTEPAPAATEPIELVLNCPNPPTAPFGKLAAAWTAKVEEATGGAVTFNIYHSPGLFEASETLRSMLSGVADFALNYTGREDANLMVLSSWWSIPYLGFKSQQQGTYIAQGLLKAFPEMKDEYQGLMTYAPRIIAQPTTWHFTNKEVKSLADMEGVKLLAIGKEAIWMPDMGAVPVTVGFMDIYVSLQKGLIDGDYLSTGGVMSINTIELYKYALDLPAIVGCNFSTMLINPDSWSGLPADVQGVISDLEPWYIEESLGIEGETAVAVRAMMKEAGIVFNEVSEEEMERDWKPIFLPQHKAWVTGVEEQGKPGQQVYDEAQRLIAAYSE